MLTPRATTLLVLLAIAGLLAGCAAEPPVASSAGDPVLAAIEAEMVSLVDGAWHDPEITWHSGWIGNMFVNTLRGRHRGLCHHWQDYVFDRIRPVAERLAWAVMGVCLNPGTSREHHAVIVYDPVHIGADRLLAASSTTPVYVLDAWRRGRPDIYAMADWLRIPEWNGEPAILEVLPWFHEKIEGRPPEGTAARPDDEAAGLGGRLPSARTAPG